MASTVKNKPRHRAAANGPEPSWRLRIIWFFVQGSYHLPQLRGGRTIGLIYHNHPTKGVFLCIESETQAQFCCTYKHK